MLMLAANAFVRDIAAAPMEFSADWDLTGFISFEANEGSVEHMGSEHMGSLMQSIGSTNASGNEDDATSTLPVITLRNFNKCIRE